MWWRSVYSSTNGFAYESFIDELAMRPVRIRLNSGKSSYGRRRRKIPNCIGETGGIVKLEIEGKKIQDGVLQLPNVSKALLVKP
jgi:hypothetical protein